MKLTLTGTAVFPDGSAVDVADDLDVSLTEGGGVRISPIGIGLSAVRRPVSPPAPPALSAQPVAYWPLTASGTATRGGQDWNANGDYTGGAFRDTTPSGGVLAMPQPLTWFNGVDVRGNWSLAGRYRNNGGSVIFNRQSAGGQTSIQFSNGGSPNYFLTVQVGSAFLFTQVADDNYHDVLVTGSGGSLKLYVDGVQRATATVTDAIVTDGTDNVSLYDPAPGSYFSQLAFWAATLTAADATLIHGKSGDLTTLLT